MHFTRLLSMLQFAGTMSTVWKTPEKKFSDLKEQLLFNRGISTKEDQERFFNPKISDFNELLAIPKIDKAQARIKKAIKEQQLIVIYGDYDVDGVCASAILYKALSSIGAKVLPYIPHREKEGYGLSKIGLDNVKEKGAGLVITVDNGIVALEQAKYAKSIGLDLIITDHHLPLDTLPDAFTIVHSTKMCGAAVAWCLIREIIEKPLAKELLQFVCIATICDMIPLTGLGRAFVVEGLQELNSNPNLGLKELANCSKLNVGEIDSFAIGHVIGPRINAVGRLEHAIDGLRLICTSDVRKARELAQLLCETNLARRDLTSIAVEEARLLIPRDNSPKINVVFNANWNPGIIGLVAARVTEEFYRPSIAISVGKTVSKGSARSIGGINIVEVIRQCSDILIDVGGHTGAAGFSLQSHLVEEFKTRIEKIASDLPENAEQVLEIDAELHSKDLTKKLVAELADFAPFGFGNPQPLFTANQMRITDLRTLSEGKHLKFKADGFDVIAFGKGDLFSLLKEGQLVNLAFFLELNRFNGSESLQLKLKDIQFNN